MKASVVRKITFNSAHRLHNALWTDEKNKEVFGLCNNPNYHGHNYELHVKITGQIEEATGYVIDLKILNEILQKEISDKFDHKNLNLDTEEFRNLNPIAENIAKIIYEILKNCLSEEMEIQITLFETPRNYVIYPA